MHCWQWLVAPSNLLHFLKSFNNQQWVILCHRQKHKCCFLHGEQALFIYDDDIQLDSINCLSFLLEKLFWHFWGLFLKFIEFFKMDECCWTAGAAAYKYTGSSQLDTVNNRGLTYMNVKVRTFFSFSRSSTWACSHVSLSLDRSISTKRPTAILASSWLTSKNGCVLIQPPKMNFPLPKCTSLSGQYRDSFICRLEWSYLGVGTVPIPR